MSLLGYSICFPANILSLPKQGKFKFMCQTLGFTFQYVYVFICICVTYVNA